MEQEVVTGLVKQKKGENYGWKILGWGGKNYSGTKIGPKWKPGFTKAIHYWVPSIATSAITIYRGNEFKEWNGHALITSLKDKSLRKIIF
jgi:quinoprotein glucose dehydrogenase